MTTVAGALLVLVLIVVLNQVREGTLGTWVRAKFFGAGDPNRPDLDRDGLGGLTGGAVGDAVPSGLQSGGWIRPTSGRVSSPFGPRESPGGFGSTNHPGIDLAAPVGTPVRASRAGRVTWSGSKGTAGIAVEIDHGGGWSSRYYHLNRTAVRRGAEVTAGQTIGEVGTTGRVTGPHLHFEIRRQGTPVDPAPYIGVGAEAVAV